MIDRRLNSAGRLAELFVTSKLTVLFMLACTLLGLLAVTLTPREENPQIVVPGAEVRVLLPGASSEEVEELVIRPLEGIVKQIPGVDHTYATAVNSMGALMVQFKVGEDKEKSLVKLYDRILGQRDRLPSDAGNPLIRSVDVDDVPIVTVTLASEKYDDYALKRLADRMLEGLRSLEAVSATYVQGGRDRELRVELDPERLQAFGVTLDQVRTFLTAGNVSAPLGTVVQQGQNRNVFLDGFLASAADLQRLIVGNHAGRPIYLGDVAHVVDGPPDEREKLTRFAFGPADARFNKTQQPELPAVTLAVAKKRGTNAVFVANDVLERIERMQAQFVPPGVELVVTRNDGQKADAAVNGLIALGHRGVRRVPGDRRLLGVKGSADRGGDRTVDPGADPGRRLPLRPDHQPRHPVRADPACPESARRHAAASDQARSNLGRGKDHRGHDPARRDLGSTVPGGADTDREIAGREGGRVAQ